MKKSGSLLCALALVAFAGPAAAQMNGRAMELGLKGGLTFSNISVDDDEGTDFGNLTGFGGGAFLRIPLGRVALQPEVLYLRKGTTASGGDLDDVELEVRLDYVEIPLLLMIPFGTGEGVSPYLLGGGAIAFEAGCEFGLDAGGVSLNIDCDEGEEEDVEFQRKSFDYGAVIGAGIQVPVGAGAFLVEGRYTFGLADLNDSGDDNSVKNRSAAVMIGYSFTLGR